MRLVVHDYAGHPFQVQLSRALARRGHEVHHLYCGKLLTPRGSLIRKESDPSSFHVAPIEPRAEIRRRSLIRRRLQEIAYGRKLLAAVSRRAPDVVMSANSPLDVQRMLLRWCRGNGARFVFWAQDLIGVGATRVLSRRFGTLGRWIGERLQGLEAKVLRDCDAVVLITEDFQPILDGWGVPRERVHAVQNWGPLEEVPLRPKVNPWSRRQGLDERRVVLYAGTLGMKHDPALLVELADALAPRADTRLVVLSEGPGADWLRERCRGHVNVLVLGFQKFEDMPDVLAAADVLVVLLESDAGVFSVPSKVLTGLCAGRPQVLAVPRENLAARIVEEAGAGIGVEPSDRSGFVAAVHRLLDDESLGTALGVNARRYAERHFRIDVIADRFERILMGACDTRAPAASLQR